MEDKKTADFLLARVKRCVTGIKVCVIVLMSLVIVITAFAAIAAGTGLNVRNPVLTLAFVAAAGGLAVLTAVALFITVILAYKAVAALKKAEENKVE